METSLNIFNSVEFLEPRCPKCNVILKYGTNTKFDKEDNHVCVNCGTAVE